MTKIIDIPCDVCQGSGIVTDCVSEDQVCIMCDGTGDVHKKFQDPIILIYQEGGQIQHVCATEAVHVVVLDNMEDPIAGKKFSHILSQGDFQDIAW